MVGWIILAVIVAILAAILLIPVGADVRYEEGVVRVSAKAAGIRLQLIPRPKKPETPEKPKKEKKKKEKKPKPPKESPEEEAPKEKRAFPFNADEILELLKTVLRGFGRFGRKFRVERFVLHWVATGWEPYTTARAFSIVNAGLSQLAPLCAERFHCKDSSVWTDIDFVRDEMFLEFGLTATIRIGQILGTGLGIGFGALKILLRSRKRRKREAKEEARALEAWLKEHPEDRPAASAESGSAAEDSGESPPAPAAETEMRAAS